MPPLKPTPAAIACISRYGTFLSLATIFSPAIQSTTTRSLERTFLGTAPTLQAVCEAYGRPAAESWVETQLKDLSDFSGTQWKLSIRQMEAIAQVIVAKYPWLRLTELAYFFFQFKSGEYDKFYGSQDSLAITSALKKFVTIRRKEIRSRLYEQITEREKAEEEQRRAAYLKQKYLTSSQSHSPD